MSWIRVEADWWRDGADALPRPWPRPFVLMDLRWWADRERMGLPGLPGRPTLMRRWGWTDHAVQRVLAAAWRDPAFNSRPTADRQPTDSRPTGIGAEMRAIARSDRQPTDSRPTADRQPTDSFAPRQSTITDTITGTDHAVVPAPTPSPTHDAHEDAPRGAPPAVPAGASPPVLEPTPVPPEGGRPPPRPRADRHAEAIARAWEAYRARHPRHGDRVPKAWAGLLRGAIVEHGEDAVRLVLDWAHLSGDDAARWLRGEAEGATREFLGLDNLLRASKLPGRLEAARSWDAAGRTSKMRPAATGPRNGHNGTPATFLEAWARVEERRAAERAEEQPC